MSRLALTAAQRQLHNRLTEHHCAPHFNYACGDMLTTESLSQVKQFEAELSHQPFWTEGKKPAWLGPFVERVFREVPHFRAQGRAPRAFEDISPVGREVLRAKPWTLVPDDLSLQALTVYTTSGTSGTKLTIPTDPTVSSLYLVLLENLLARENVRLPRGPDKVAIALVACQQETLTYAAISHTLDGAGFLKLNLAPHVWRRLEDRKRYLTDAEPVVFTGSPYAFEVLWQVAPELRPQALVSSAVTLHDGHAASLRQRFGCPVFDLYSMTESRGIAGRSAGNPDFALLSPDLYVETLGPDDEPVALGQVGEIVLTGGRNPYLPLLRYRTGDRAVLTYLNGQPCLRHFEGREAVQLEKATGEIVPTLDVVHALRSLPLIGLALQQKADRSLHFSYAGEVSENDVKAPLESLFASKVAVRKKSDWDGKTQRFSSELANDLSAASSHP